MSQRDYDVICSYTKRVAERADALFSGDFRRWLDLGRYYRLATELAFDKRRLTNFPAERDTQARVVQLRNQVAVLGNKL